MSARQLRCAVYTRKSTEEGLDQDFNSLDAQFEACAAFIASQAGLGWKGVRERYDDGGISGATMERPALRRLLDDVRKARVDVIVVYKIDRLTRSLADFARIVETLDQAGASFVSVTQQFNTTTSMGRLTLNVLLSFAQFEREVTAERIRDKIAASKKKGMWMGGTVPLGYRVENRKLQVNEEECATVRYLFHRYLELKSVRLLVEDARSRGLHARPVKRRDGSVKVTAPFGRGNLYHLLSNPIYVGRIRHRDKVYDGEHQAIIDKPLFDQVQASLAAGAGERRSPTNRTDSHLLTGLIFDEDGNRIRTAHTNRKGVRYRYYVSQHLVDQRRDGSEGWRLPADRLDATVEQCLVQFLQNSPMLSEAIELLAPTGMVHSGILKAGELASTWIEQSRSKRKTLVQTIVQRVDITPGALRITIHPTDLVELLLGRRVEPVPDHGPITLERPFTLRRRGVETRLVLTDGSASNPEPDPALINLVLRAQAYLAALTDGASRSMADIARAHGTTPSEISRILPLAFLSPGITAQIVSGKHPAGLTAQRLSRLPDLPLSWSAQDDLLTRFG